MVHLNHSQQQDIDIMAYQKKCKAGQIQNEQIKETQHQLKCMIASLENIKIYNRSDKLRGLDNYKYVGTRLDTYFKALAK